MVPVENDISWSLLRRIARAWAGAEADIAQVKPLAGGSVGSTLLIRLKGDASAVLKITPHRYTRHHEHEAHNLRVLGELGVPVPRVHLARAGTLDDPNSYILMEYMPGRHLSVAKRELGEHGAVRLERHLAEIVATMHGGQADTCHRVELGDIEGHSDWREFLHELYEPLWREVCAEGTLPAHTARVFGKLHEHLKDYLPPVGKPALIHGDLWDHNILCHTERADVVALLDPNSRYGDPEMELAYLEQFHTVGKPFFARYWELRPASAEYRTVKRSVYQAYFLLAQYERFGGDYLAPFVEACERVRVITG